MENDKRSLLKFACGAFVYLHNCVTDASGLPAEDLVLQRLIHYYIGHFLQVN